VNNWPVIMEDLDKLSFAAELPKLPQRDMKVDEIQNRIISNLAFAINERQRATIIEVALTVGATGLIEAVPAVKERMLVRLDHTSWRIALRNCTADDIRCAMTKGLDLAEGFDLMFNTASFRDDMRHFVLNDLAQEKFWMSRRIILTKTWFGIEDSDLAAEFLKAQARNFPQDAREALVEMIVEEHSLPAIVWQVALGEVGTDVTSEYDPLGKLVKCQPSNHKALAVRHAHRSVAAVHDFYT
jgi:hypothetical protein